MSFMRRISRLSISMSLELALACATGGAGGYDHGCGAGPPACPLVPAAGRKAPICSAQTEQMVDHSQILTIYWMVSKMPRTGGDPEHGELMYRIRSACCCHRNPRYSIWATRLWHPFVDFLAERECALTPSRVLDVDPTLVCCRADGKGTLGGAMGAWLLEWVGGTGGKGKAVR